MKPAGMSQEEDKKTRLPGRVEDGRRMLIR
jgi:hypothetical protein